MTESATHSYLVRTGNGGSLEDLARLRADPEYTMQAVAQQTGVPPDTLRSWERRHGFPVPVRNGSNRRLYSERDISAIHWLRDQTDHGQGIREAVSMLMSHLNGNAAAAPDVSHEPVPDPGSTHLESFIDALTSSRIDVAQRAWDQFALSMSVEGLCTGVILPACQQLQDASADGALSRPHLLRAMAFLRRKTLVLLDHAGPDLGQPSICLAISSGDVPALALATLLARAGFQIVTPILHAASTDAIAIIRDVHPAVTIVVTGSGVDTTQLASFASLLPEHDMAVWAPFERHNAVALPSGIVQLPSPLMDAVNALRSERQ
jgi:DNA-binding transcriptional MerR regulator